MRDIILLTITTLRKDWKIYTSYKFNYIGEIFFIFYISEIFDANDSKYLSKYNGNYFLFLLTGVSVILFLSRTFSSMPFFITSAQTYGFIESLICMKYKLAYILLASNVFPLLQGLARVIILFLIAYIFDPASINLLSIIEILFILVISSIPFIGISFFVSGVILYFKRANFLLSFILLGCTTFSGIIFPIEVLPIYLQSISIILPSSTSVELIRGRIIEQISYLNFVDEFLIIFFASIIYLFLGIMSFEFFLKKSKQKGTASHY